MKFIFLLKQFFTRRRIRHSELSQAIAEGIQELFIEMGYRVNKRNDKA